MGNFTDRLTTGVVAPVVLAISFLPSGEAVSQTKPGSDAAIAAVVKDLRQMVQGRNVCVAAYPQPAEKSSKESLPSGKVTSYTGTTVCGGEIMNFHDLVRSLETVTRQHNNQPPTSINLELKAGTAQAKSTKIETQKIIDLIQALNKKNIQPDAEHRLYIGHGDANQYKIVPLPEATAVIFTMETLNTVPADTIAEHIQRSFIQAQQKREEERKPRIMI